MFLSLSGSCSSVTESKLDTISAFSFDLLPEINRDLKICDLVKEQNVLLTSKVALYQVQVYTERQEKEAALKEVKKEKRKRIVQNVVRTVAEVAAIIIVLKIL